MISEHIFYPGTNSFHSSNTLKPQPLRPSDLYTQRPVLFHSCCNSSKPFGNTHVRDQPITRLNSVLCTYTILDFRTFFQKPRPGDETALLARAGLGILQSPGCMTKPHFFFSIQSDGHPKFKRLRRRYDLKGLVSQANLTSSSCGRMR